MLYIHTLLAAEAMQMLPALLTTLIMALFVIVLVMNRIIARRVKERIRSIRFTTEVMKKALKISDDNVARCDVRTHHISKLYGHILPDEGISLEDWEGHIHPDDVEEVKLIIAGLLDGTTPTAEYSYRWNYEYGGGKPRWGYLRTRSVVEFRPGTKIPVSVISTLTDEARLREQTDEERDMTERYQTIFENSIVGQSFYTPDGWLVNSNAEMRKICHFDSVEGDEFFSNANLFETPPFNEVLNRNNVEEFWVCSQSIIPERDMREHLEIRLRPIRDDVGKLVYISVTARNITGEREMYLQAKRNDIELRKANAEIQRYEEELRYLMETCNMYILSSDQKTETLTVSRSLKNMYTISFEDHLKMVAEEDRQKTYETLHMKWKEPFTFTCNMMRTSTNPERQCFIMSCMPTFDEQGNVTGHFGVARNITQFVERQEQLKQETERANDSGRQKSVFLANMTHEIRTPLNAIVGFSDLLHSIDGADERREMIRIIHNNCDMLLRLINDILVLSNMDANAMQIVPENIDFAKEFNDICQSLSQRVSEPAVEFLVDNPMESLPVSIDNGRIEQVITNFVTNAVKYTQQGHIRVGYRLEERKGNRALYVYCEDTGTGIPSDQLQKVFERFVKLNDFIQGTGLGLSICKAIVEKCGGEIGVESEVGKGSTFWFWIPV